MFTDTKNLTNTSGTLNDACGTLTAHKPGRMRKLWKPLRSFITPKSRSATVKHPNNVGLNNASSAGTSGTSAADLMHSPLGADCGTTKVSKEHLEAEFWAQQELQSTSSPDSEPCVISSASITKTNAATCHDCAYGPNCQHEQFHAQSGACRSNCQQSTNAATTASEELDNVPVVHIVCADNGVWCWSPGQHNADDELLQTLLLSSLRQLSV